MRLPSVCSKRPTRVVGETGALKLLRPCVGVLLESESDAGSAGREEAGDSPMKPLHIRFPQSSVRGNEAGFAAGRRRLASRCATPRRKGAGKTTTARAAWRRLLPPPAPFINLPIGATEDRLSGGLTSGARLEGRTGVETGLLSEAHGGVLYMDEINLLPAHLGDMLLDTASSG